MSTSVESVGQSSASPGTLSQSVAGNSELGKDAFLQLLVTELTNQDPLNPVDQTEYIAQMAQFSAVEQMSNMGETLESMAGFMQFSAASMVGTKVTYVDADGVNVAATVDSVLFEQGNVLIGVDNGDKVPIERVVSAG